MKVLESSPHRYDRGIRILTLGKIDEIYDRLIANINKGDRVLDIGCGTGLLSIRAINKGASVVGIDINPQMLEIAAKRAEQFDCQTELELLEMGVAEMDKFEDSSFDKVISSLCFSELPEYELEYTLKHTRRILKEDGLLVLGDENKPKTFIKKMLNFIIRFPLVLITYILTQTTTSALTNIIPKLRSSGFEPISVRKNKLENFVEIIARKSKEKLS
ncbi:MAG: class I SAM-dependent methyltransferase [Candidatus Heimdallarchaeota archaeon]|nr:class I SAM-dependent methyltransferase [Candidatus Heimdallarchaeota archaeon]